MCHLDSIRVRIPCLYQSPVFTNPETLLACTGPYHTHNMKQQLNTHTTPSARLLLALPGELDGTLTLSKRGWLLLDTTLTLSHLLHGLASCSQVFPVDPIYICHCESLSHQGLLHCKLHLHAICIIDSIHFYTNYIKTFGHFEVLYTFSFQSCIPPTNGAGYVTPMYIPYLGFMAVYWCSAVFLQPCHKLPVYLTT